MGSRRPKIVHVITRLELGGAQQNTLYCVEHHDRTRFEVSLIAGEGGILDPRARAIGAAKIHIVPWLVHPIAPLTDASAVVRLASMLKDVDLVHTHSSKAGILGRAAGRLTGLPGIIHTVHGWSFNDSQPPVMRRLYLEAERAAARCTDRIVCVSRFDRDRGIASGIGHAAQYRLVRSGIDAALYAAPPGARDRLRASFGARPDDVVVGCIANFKAQKGPLDFVEAARRARLRDDRLRFFIAGDGELRPAVERAIQAADLGGVVHLLGWRDDVPELLAAMDIFLLTSLFEGLPRVVLQAMAASVAVVATDTGGVAEVVSDETGRLVAPGDTASAADAVVALASDAQMRRRMGEAARSRLGAEFDSRRMVAELEDLYEEVLGRPHGTRVPATSPSHLGGESWRH